MNESLQAAAAQALAAIDDYNTPVTRNQRLQLAAVHAQLATAQELRVANALAALALGTSALDYAHPDKARGESTAIRQQRLNGFRKVIRASMDIPDDGTVE